MANQYTTKHDLNTLPNWAQKQFKQGEITYELLRSKMETLQNMNAVMCEPKRDWFTLPFSFDKYEVVHLWLLDHDQPIPVCAIGKGDLLFIGRAKKEPAEKSCATVGNGCNIEGGCKNPEDCKDFVPIDKEK